MNNISLNEEQQNAVDAILEGWKGRNGYFFIFPIVEGPPGTGKTYLGVRSAIEHIQQKGGQIAYLTYTHYAAEKAREDFLKLGFTPNQVVRLTPNRGEKDWEKGIIGCGSRLQGLTEDEKRRVSGKPVLISTLHSSGRIFSEKMGKQNHRLIIVDEFSQVTPSLFFSTLSQAATERRDPLGYALLGDPNQLPIVTTQVLLRANIGTFIIARKHGYKPHQLTLQYRMHENICEVVNVWRENVLHTYPLKPAEEVKKRKLTDSDLDYKWISNKCPVDFHKILTPENTAVFINTDNLLGWEEKGLGRSTYYESEAHLVANLVKAVVRSYIHKEDGYRLLPTILSPYNAQIGMIQEFLQNHKELQEQYLTIYKAQGREYPCVIVSLVRKNPYGDLGFLGEPNLRAQTYVACSRAQAKLIVLLSFKTFNQHPDYRLWLKRCKDNATIVEDSSKFLGLAND